VFDVAGEIINSIARFYIFLFPLAEQIAEESAIAVHARVAAH
jgi:hypothetical protein